MDYADCSSSSASSSSNDRDHLLPSPSSASFSSSSSLISSTYNNNSSTPKRKAGRKKFRETRHPVYRGVRERNSGKWVCEVREPNKKSRIWLGTYPTPEMAARAHDVAAMALRGKSAVLNFADSALVLPRASSASADEIRRVASQAAEMFRPSPSRASPEKIEEEVKEVSSSSSSRTKQPAADPVVYVDEDALFNMPGLMREMAEGMMLSPPGMQQEGGGGFDWDQAGDEVHLDMSLWSY